MTKYSDTYTYTLLDNQFNLSTRTKGLFENSIIIPKDAFFNSTLYIEKNMNIPIKKQVLNDFYNESLICIIKDISNNYTFPSSIVAVPMKANDDRKIKMLVNTSNYCKIETDVTNKITNAKIGENTLFALLSSAWFYRKYMIDESRIKTNVKFIKLVCKIYSALLYKVLDARYSIGAIYSSIDETRALISYFAALYFFNYKYASDIAAIDDNILDKNASRTFMERIKTKYTSFESFEDLINALNAEIKGLGKVVSIDVVSEYCRLYGSLVIPSMDYLPFFISMILSSYCSGGLGRDIAVSSVVKTDAVELVKTLETIYGN